MTNSLFAQFFFLISLLTIVACNPDDNGGMNSDPCNPDFDQTAFFEHIANNSIIPGYDQLQLVVQDLKTGSSNFLENLNEATLLEIRAKYTTAYIEWQKVAMYEFGPAKSVFLRNSLNNFPLNEEQLLENIQTGIYDFGMPDRFDKGFPALDFLLFGLADNDNDIVNSYIIGTNSEKFKAYLEAVISDMLTRVNSTQAAWKDGYVNEFINNKGTAAGTSLSLIINGFNENYELIKREKLGVPSGVLTLGIPNPDRVEAIHSGLSTQLLQAAFSATTDLFKGNGRQNGNGPGLDDYLDAANAKKADGLLSEVINSQFDVTQGIINGFSNPLDEAINNDKESVIAAYNEVTKQLVNIKTDLPSVLCVSITYIDNPSDSD